VRRIRPIFVFAVAILDFAKTKPGTSYCYLEILSRQMSSANLPPLRNDNVLLAAHD
jgi:hypothetical protein